MKRILTLLIFATGLFASAAQAAPDSRVRGLVKDANGEPIGFCTVIFALSTDTLRVRGDISNAEGFFDMTLPAGEYRLTVAMMGYEPYRREVVLNGDADLGTIELAESTIKIEAAVVTADMVHRRADGYVFLPAGSSITTGRSSLELLSYAPGVWVDKDRGITINGKSGTRVMVNDRMLNFTTEELTAYLESINAEQIRSIEVIPDPGAQYDADSAGGILKITLKRTMNGGLSGSVGMNLTAHDDLFPGQVRPSVNLEYRKDRLSLYTNIYYGKNKSLEETHEYTKYESSDNREIDGTLNFKVNSSNFGGRIGSVYELTDRQSVGLDFDYSKTENNRDGLSVGRITHTGYEAQGLSAYRNAGDYSRHSVSFNYKLKTDDKGSNLMFMADYMYNRGDQFESNHATETSVPYAQTESNSNSNRLSQTDYYTLRTDYKHYINQKFQLETGAKYAYTDMDTDIRYDDFVDDQWVPVDALNDHYLYREGVLAGYVNGSANLGRWNLSAGLRAENTDLRPHSYIAPDQAKRQNYTDFFPTARAVYFIRQEKGHLLNASYTRRISRPGFSQLNPFRMQLNNYTYVVGNPDMQPAYADSYSLTGVVGNKYSLTVGYNDITGAVRQIVLPDPENPEILLYQHRNVDRVRNLFVSASLPIQIQKWWRMSVDAFAMQSRNKIGVNEINGDMFQGQLNNLLTFRKNWSAEVNYTYISGFIQGNMEASNWDFLNLSIKKTFFDNRLTASFSVDNVLDDGGWHINATIRDPGKFTKQLDMRSSNNPARRYGLSLRWNFRTGKDTKSVQKVVFGNEEERGR